MKIGLFFRHRSKPSPMEGKIAKEEVEKDKANHGKSQLTQENINRMVAKGKVRLLLPNFMPQLKSAPGPWTFKRAHFNDFSKSGDTRSWEDHDWLECTLKVGTTQVALAHFMLECNMNSSSDDDQCLVVNKEEEGDDEMISCWSGDDDDQFFNEVGRDFPNKGEELYDIAEAMHVRKPLKKDDRSAKLKKDEGKSVKP